MQSPGGPIRFFDKKNTYIDPQGKKLRVFKPSKPLFFSIVAGTALFVFYLTRSYFIPDFEFELRPQSVKNEPTSKQQN